MPQREQYLFVCVNRRPDGSPKGSCAERGSEEIFSSLRTLLADRGLMKVKARACSCSCLDMCADGPSIVVEPHHVIYARVTLEDLPEIAEAVAAGTIVDRLVIKGSGDPSRGS